MLKSRESPKAFNLNQLIKFSQQNESSTCSIYCTSVLLLILFFLPVLMFRLLCCSLCSVVLSDLLFPWTDDPLVCFSTSSVVFPFLVLSPVISPFLLFSCFVVSPGLFVPLICCSSWSVLLALQVCSNVVPPDLVFLLVYWPSLYVVT